MEEIKKNDDYVITVKKNGNEILNLKSDSLLEAALNMADLPLKFVETLSGDSEKIGFVFGYTLKMSVTHDRFKEVLMNIKPAEKTSCDN